jgi:exo-beta-1,3-glucanase (GH17 family)
MDYVDPNAVIDDGDDGLEYYNPKRRSMISLNRRSMGSNTALAATAATAVAGGAAAGNGQTLQNIAPEKSTAPFTPFVPDDETKSRKWKKILFICIAILILCAIAGGVVGGLIANHKLGNIGSSSSSSSSSAAVPGVDGPDMDINSPSVKKLLKNPNLHKVFMGMAYTPMNTQYPGCNSLAPIQNNVTLDLAVLSQVTNTIRLYGTDCNQTEMVLHAIDRLQPLDMKVWIGVWLNSNETTNTRQVSQLWSILDNYGTKYVKGVIVGNEVLYRQDLTLAQLSTYISGVRTNLTSRGFNIPVASADLGDNWTSALADVVDVVMANVHPFFGGVSAPQAAGWTYTFWTGHDVVLTQGTTKTNVISEVGWPSQGGTDCAPLNPPCPDLTAGAVSGIPEMVTFLDDWVCQTMKNGTEYFW